MLWRPLERRKALSMPVFRATISVGEYCYLMVDRSRMLGAASRGLVSGVLTLYPLGRAPWLVRWGVGAVTVTFSSALVWRGQRAPGVQSGSSPLSMVALAAGLSAATWAGGLWADRAIETGLGRVGVRHPRVVMAIAAGLTMTALQLAATHSDESRDVGRARRVTSRTPTQPSCPSDKSAGNLTRAGQETRNWPTYAGTYM